MDFCVIRYWLCMNAIQIPNFLQLLVSLNSAHPQSWFHLQYHFQSVNNL